MKPNFSNKTAKIIAEIRTKTCIDEIDAEVIKDILQDTLNEYYRMLDESYAEEHYNAIITTRNRAYDDGHSDGYADGYESGYADCHDKNNYAV